MAKALNRHEKNSQTVKAKYGLTHLSYRLLSYRFALPLILKRGSHVLGEICGSYLFSRLLKRSANIMKVSRQYVNLRARL